MLGGLIPLFIGLALLITYFLTRNNNNKEKALAQEAALVAEGESVEPGSPSASGTAEESQG
jgi:hypothetical protein